MVAPAVGNALTGSNLPMHCLVRQVADIESFFKYPVSQTISG